MAQSYDTLSFVFRYWFLFLAAMMLLLLVLNSRSEYRERKAVMGEVGQYIGYLEIVGGADDSYGVRIGLTAENLVGSGKSADIIINDRSVLKNHAMIVRKDKGVMLQPLSEKAEIKINGRRAVRAHRISTGDIVSFGDIDAKVYLKPRKGGANDH